jgi:hypothetical protein
MTPKDAATLEAHFCLLAIQLLKLDTLEREGKAGPGRAAKLAREAHATTLWVKRQIEHERWAQSSRRPM